MFQLSCRGPHIILSFRGNKSTLVLFISKKVASQNSSVKRCKQSRLFCWWLGKLLTYIISKLMHRSILLLYYTVSLLSVPSQILLKFRTLTSTECRSIVGYSARMKIGTLTQAYYYLSRVFPLLVHSRYRSVQKYMASSHQYLLL